ncbi:hypothetical protein CVT25_012156 [Psilocybe cyanescens]|uniref:Uncharacterized protein n=1 Tax=Psilocybe cyanescens TaxID=93625 RepID=A0A409XC28_PSICY|nr:hypothetical protein CVT25_012156 [Psilocybe cyanescens]
MVLQYKYNWWNKHSASATLNNKKLHAALNFHSKQLQSAHQTTELPDDKTWFPSPSPTLPPVPGINLLSTPKIPVPVVSANPSCTMCNIYQQMAVDLYQMNVDAVCNTQQLLSLAETESLLCEHRVVGFYKVHEAALLKETANVPTTRMESESALALFPLDRSQWTWGEALTHKDVLALGQSQQGEIHTGYGIELEDGNIAGSDSETRNTIGSCVQENQSPHSTIQTNVHSPACNTIATISDHTNIKILPPQVIPQGSIHVQAALSNMFNNSKAEIVPPTSVHRGSNQIQDALANMSNDNEVEIVSVFCTTQSWAALDNMSDGDEVKINSLTNIGLTALANMSDNSDIEIVENPTQSNEDGQSQAQNLSSSPPFPKMLASEVGQRSPLSATFNTCALAALDNMSNESQAPSLSLFQLRTQAALDNMSDDDTPPPPPEATHSHTPFDLQSRALEALENMSDESWAPSPSSFRLCAQAALDNMSDDDKHPSATGTHAGTLLDVPVRCLVWGDFVIAQYTTPNQIFILISSIWEGKLVRLITITSLAEYRLRRSLWGDH